MRNTSLSHEEALWAFGDDYMSCALRTIPFKWNDRHGDLFKIHGGASRVITELKIKEAFNTRHKMSKGNE